MEPIGKNRRKEDSRMKSGDRELDENRRVSQAVQNSELPRHTHPFDKVRGESFARKGKARLWLNSHSLAHSPQFLLLSFVISNLLITRAR